MLLEFIRPREPPGGAACQTVLGALVAGGGGVEGIKGFFGRLRSGKDAGHGARFLGGGVDVGLDWGEEVVGALEAGFLGCWVGGGR